MISQAVHDALEDSRHSLPAPPALPWPERLALVTKALSVQQPWAGLIADGAKTIEYRSWYTPHRGPLLICSGGRIDRDGFADLPCSPDLPIFARGVAVCVVDVIHVQGERGEGFRWYLAHAVPVLPFAVRGKLQLFPVEKDMRASIARR